MVPTRRLWGLLAAGIPIGAVGAIAGQPYLFVAYDVVVLLVAWVTGRFGPDPKTLLVSRATDPALSVRRANRVELTVVNDGGEALVGRLRDEPPEGVPGIGEEFDFRLEPGDGLTRVYTVTPPERGAVRFRGTFVRLDCPLGLVRREAIVDPGADAKVYPDLLALREFDLLNQTGRHRDAGLRRTRERGLGTEFESLRDYALGDDYRKVDHKATARRGKAVVRQFEQERNQSVLLVVDTGRAMLAEVEGVRKLDHTLDALLLLAHAAARAGDGVGLLAFDDRVRHYLPPRKGKSQTGAVLAACHDLRAELAESDPLAAFAYLEARWKRRSLVVVFSDVDDDVRAQELAAALAPLRRRHLVMVVRVEDPEVGRLRRTEPTDLAALRRRAAMSILDEERRTADRYLAAAGIRTLEAAPDRLAAALVGAYLKVKERGEL